MIVEITDDDMDLFNYESYLLRMQQCNFFRDVWGVNILYNYSKEIQESIARGAKIYAERHQESIDPIGHYEDTDSIKIAVNKKFGGAKNDI